MAKEKNPHAVAMGKLSAQSLSPNQRKRRAQKAGQARIGAIPPAKRREIARKAAEARWGKEKKQI